MRGLRRTLGDLWNRVINPRTVDARLSLAVEGANDSLWDWNLRTNRIYHSNRWAASLGYTSEEIGENADEWVRYIHPDDLPVMNAAMKDYLDGKTPFFQSEFRIRAKNGSYRWMFSRAVAARDSKGKAYRVAGSMTDVTLFKGTQALLANSERRYRSLFAATFEAIFIHDAGRILDVNEAFEQQFGYSRSESIGKYVPELASPEARAFVESRMDQELSPLPLTTTAQRKDGTTFPAEAHTKEMEYGGRTVRVTAVRNITEHHNAESAERARRQLAEALLDSARAANSTLDLNEVLKNMLENVGRVVPHDGAEIMLIENREIKVLKAQGRILSDVPQWVREGRFNLDDVKNLSAVVKTQKPVIIRDTRTDPEWIAFPETSWILSHLSAPIVVNGEVLALINISSDQPNGFTERDADNLMLFAAGAGFALKNARLYEAEFRAKQRTQTLLKATQALSSMTELADLLQTILDQAAVVVPYVSGSIGIFENGQFKFKALAGFRDEHKRLLTNLQAEMKDSPSMHQILTTRQPVMISDTRTYEGWLQRPELPYIHSWMGLPLLLGDRVLGIVSLDGDQAGIFTAEHMAMAQAFAANAAIAIARVELLEAEREARQSAQALLQANRILSSTLSLGEVLENILQQCSTVLPYAQGIILAYGDGAAPIISMRGYDNDTQTMCEYLKTEFRESDLFHFVKAYPKPLMLTDVLRFEGWLNMPGSADIRGWMGVPLVVRGDLVGLLMVCSDTVEAYHSGHVTIASAFADQAAIAIHNAQLYQGEQAERALAETLQQTAEALASSLQLDATLRLIMDLLSQVVAYDTAAVWLIEDEFVRLIASRGFSEYEIEALSKPHRASDAALIQSMIEGKPVLLADTHKDPRWVTPSGAVTVPHAWIGVPLVAFNSTVGMLTVGSYQPDTYTQRDMDAITAFASQAAVAIENSRLLRELEDSVYNLRMAQTQLMQSARLSAAGEVSLGVAHQINNPLTIIIAEAHLMRRHIPSESPLEESLSAINSAARTAGNVVQRMLDFARTRPTELTEVDLRESINTVLTLFRAQLGEHVSLITDIADPLPTINGSEEHLGEVWLNLLLNARDALQNTPNAVIRVQASLDASGDAVEVRFSDNGAGIAPEDVGKIFEPFYTTKKGGTGLGLALSRDSITTQGGSLNVEIGQGSGTTFVIRLPLYPQSSEMAAVNPLGGSSDRKNIDRR